MAATDFQAFLSLQLGDLQRQVDVLQGRLSARHQDDLRPLFNKISKLKADNHALRQRLDIRPPPPEEKVPLPPEDDVVAVLHVNSRDSSKSCPAPPKGEPAELLTDSASSCEVEVPEKRSSLALPERSESRPSLLDTAQIDKPSPICSLSFVLDSKPERKSLSDEYAMMGEQSQGTGNFGMLSRDSSVFMPPGEVHDGINSASDGAVKAFSRMSSVSNQNLPPAEEEQQTVGKTYSSTDGSPRNKTSSQIASCQRAHRHSESSELTEDNVLLQCSHGSEESDGNSVDSSGTKKLHRSEKSEINKEEAFREMFSGKYPLLGVWAQQADSAVIRLNSELRRRSMSTRSINSNATHPEEEQRHHPRGSFLGCVDKHLMLRPNSVIHMVWDIFALFAVIWDFCVIPLQVFDANQDQASVQDALVTPSIFVRIFWLFDIPLHFLTGSIDDTGRQHMSCKYVANRYATSWLIPDLVLCALDWIELSIQASGAFPVATGVLSGCRMLRGQRLVRLSEAPELNEFMIEHIHNERVILTLSICRVLVLMSFYTHLIACGWYLITMSGQDGFTDAIEGSSIERMHLLDRYVLAFHVGLSLFTGEHVEIPRSTRERIFTIAVLLFTFMMAIWFVSTITTNMTRLQIISGQRSTQFSALSRFLADHSISRDLCIKVRRNAQYVVATQTKHTPEGSIELLSLISTPLRRELHFEVHSPLLRVHPFFREYIEHYPTAIKKVCHEAVRLLTFSPGDIVFSEFEAPAAPKMFWIADGVLNYIQDVNHRKICYGNWLSEALLWTKWTHRGTLESKMESELLGLDANSFGNIVANFPSLQVRSYAVQFCKTLETTPDEEVTDVGTENREADWLVEVAFGTGGARRGRSAASGFKGVRFQLATSVRQSMHGQSLIRSTSREENKRRGTGLLDQRRGTGMLETRRGTGLLNALKPRGSFGRAFSGEQQGEFNPKASFSILGSVLRQTSGGASREEK